MSMDLVISEDGTVMIASNAPFSGSVARVDFDGAQRCLTLSFEEKERADETLNLEPHSRMLSALLKAPSVLLVEVRHNAPVRGYSVPLTHSVF